MDWSAFNAIPHIAQLPEESACLWRATLARQGVFAPSSVREWKSVLDAAPRNLPPTLFIDLPSEEIHYLRQVYGFPLMQLPVLPDEPELSQTLVNALDSPIPNLLRQSEIAAEIVRRAKGAHIVVLLILDGLAYEDVLDWQYPTGWRWTRRPCFVDGVTLTTEGMPRVIGSPPLAHQLFQHGYKHHLGFTYWERDNNDLTNTLFAEFNRAQLIKVSEFAQILDYIAKTSFAAPTYIQIVRNGLDQFVHSYRERPNVHSSLRELRLAIQDLLELLASFHCSAHVYVTADHGILWYEKQTVVAVTESANSARYVPHDVHDRINEYSRLSEKSGSYTVAIGPNHICRSRRSNEWGFHGGISGRESLIPFVALEYKP